MNNEDMNSNEENAMNDALDGGAMPSHILDSFDDDFYDDIDDNAGSVGQPDLVSDALDVGGPAASLLALFSASSEINEIVGDDSFDMVDVGDPEIAHYDDYDELELSDDTASAGGGCSCCP